MTTATEFQWSDLARKSVDVGSALDESDEVVVTRGSRRYVLAPEDGGMKAAFAEICKVLSALAALGDDELVRGVLNRAWAWTRALPLDDQIELACEVAPLAETCESLGTWRPLLDSLESWRGTARAWATGAQPVGEFEAGEVIVARP